MNLQLEGKRAVVTGSSGGIGEAIARALAAEGARVLVHGRRVPELDRVVAAIRHDGGDAAASAAELSSDQGAESLMESAVARFGGVDILVNNAGTYDFECTWENLSPREWLDRYNENVISAVRLIRLVLPPMKAARWGRLINISSTAALMPPADLPDYSASKAALANLTVSAARDCARTGVTANTISPGIVLTAGMRTYLDKVAAERDWDGNEDAVAELALRELFNDPPGGWGRPSDIAYAVVLLASPHAAWITGADLRVDGGEAGVA
jgi:3-oxoacyl-[acyl-carrier protein] reductase